MRRSVACIVGSVTFITKAGFTMLESIYKRGLHLLLSPLIPVFILLSLASPSFSLLYSLDEITSPKLTLKIIGHQWYWSYEQSDFNLCLTKKDLKFSSYMLKDETIKENNLLGFS